MEMCVKIEHDYCQGPRNVVNVRSREHGEGVKVRSREHGEEVSSRECREEVRCRLHEHS